MTTINANPIIAEIKRYRFARLELLVGAITPSTRRDSVRTIRRSRQLHVVTTAAGMEIVTLANRRPAPVEGIARGAAIHSFCSAGPNRRTLLTSEELCRHFPRLFRFGMPSGYYVDTSRERPVLGFVRVDTGLDPVARIVRRIEQLAERHMTNAGFVAASASRHFEITYLVATDMKARFINTAIDQSQHAIRLRVIAEPLLLDLLTPLNTEN